MDFGISFSSNLEWILLHESIIQTLTSGESKGVTIDERLNFLGIILCLYLLGGLFYNSRDHYSFSCESRGNIPIILCLDMGFKSYFNFSLSYFF